MHAGTDWNSCHDSQNYAYVYMYTHTPTHPWAFVKSLIDRLTRDAPLASSNVAVVSDIKDLTAQ